jgi:GT2 family glycosyltransferase
MTESHDLAIITVCIDARWLDTCLPTIFAHAGEDLRLDMVVVDNESRDGTSEIVARDFPAARTVPSRNHGFGHGNNRGLMTCDARYVLFINPDTEVVDGTFAELVRLMDERPEVGLAGVRQLTPGGAVDATIRRFPNALRALGDALGAEKLPHRPDWLGERVLDPAAYERETACDWTSGSFMLARREALESAGWFDERFFMYSEETDLCLRIKQAGWDIRHLPQMTIVHHNDRSTVKPKFEALGAATRVMYARKHFGRLHRSAYFAALVLRHGLRFRRPTSRAVLRTLFRRDPVPFAEITQPVAVAAGRPALDLVAP